jgi:hypothetical protein
MKISRLAVPDTPKSHWSVFIPDVTLKEARKLIAWWHSHTGAKFDIRKHWRARHKQHLYDIWRLYNDD